MEIQYLRTIFDQRLVSSRAVQLTRGLATRTSLPAGVSVEGMGTSSASAWTGLETRVAELGDAIRRKKALLKQEGLTSDGINAKLREDIELLKILKSQLDSDSKFSQQSFESEKRQREELKASALAAEKAAQAERRQKRMVELFESEAVLIQRKLYHFFSFQGNGNTFRYIPPDMQGFGINSTQTQFDTSVDVTFTLKWDGTTMQATKNAVYKRLDTKWQQSKASKGGKRIDVSIKDRYDLSLICWFDESSQLWEGLDDHEIAPNLRACVSEFLQAFRRLDAGLCVYFEACHRDINSTFKDAEGFEPTIRVFDFSSEDRFLSIDACEEMSERFGLPYVGISDKLAAPWTPEAAWNVLDKMRHMDYPGTNGCKMEGFVARQGHNIAKARVEVLVNAIEMRKS